MLIHQLQGSSYKGTLTTQPLIDDDPQGILVSGRNWFPLPLLRSHVARCTNRIFRLLRIGAMSHHRNAKITEQNFVVQTKEYILGFHIAMNTSLVMSIV